MAGTAAGLRDLLRSDARVRLLALTLLGLDAALILVHAVVHLSAILVGPGDVDPADARLLLTTDRGYPEMFNYGQTALLAGLLLYVWRRSRVSAYLAWAAVFVVVGLDDSLMVHERVGTALVPLLGLPAFPGLRARDTGELLTWALLGAALLGPLALGLLRCPPEHRRANAVIGALFAALLFFAVGIDMVQIAATQVLPWRIRGIQFVEDAGEMVVISLLCAFAFLLCRHPAAALAGPAPPPRPGGAGAFHRDRGAAR